MEEWRNGEMEKWRTSIFQFTSRCSIYETEANTLAQTWFAECRSRDPLPKYYRDSSVFQAFRTRAGSNTPILHCSWQSKIC